MSVMGTYQQPPGGSILIWACGTVSWKKTGNLEADSCVLRTGGAYQNNRL